MNLSEVRTGDVLIFANNSPTGFLLQTFTSDRWNHVGLAVRFIDSEISLTTEGTLYIYETNTGSRFDHVAQRPVVGAAFSHVDFVLPKYNRVACRPLRDSLRVPLLSELFRQFAGAHEGYKFPSSALPFFSVWLGIPLQDCSLEKTEMFCSELVAHFFLQVVGPIYGTLTGHTSASVTLPNLMGANSPVEPDMYRPGHFTNELTPDACVFQGPDRLVHNVQVDFIYVIVQPLLIILVMMILISMSLPKNRN